MQNRKYTVIGLLLLLAGALLAACGGAGERVEIVEVTAEPETVVETVPVTPTPDAEAEATEEAAAEASEMALPEGYTGPFSTPHPILGDLRVRQAIAHCTDRSELISSVYPYLDEDEQAELLMDTFLVRDHWAFAEEITTYPFDADQGQALLEEAGWIATEAGQPRENEAGEPLSIKFVTTDAQFRQTWAAVLEQQLLDNCGIQMIRTHAPGAWLFGPATGLQRRDFELTAFAWIGEPDPKGSTLYACDQIPLPVNNWEGQNYMGWCNPEASRAIRAANNTIDREERIAQYAIVQREFTADMVSLPLFNRLAVAAASNNLVNFRPNPTDYYFANVGEWELADGSDSVVVAMTQEPDTLLTLVAPQATAQNINYLLDATASTSYDYDYQADALVELPTLENGGAELNTVEVQAGDTVWSMDGEAVELAPGVQIRTAEGEIITYEDGPVQMQQLAVTFEYVEGITWEDGEPLKAADFELGYRAGCDPALGRVSYTLCESYETVEFLNDTSYTIIYHPGVQWPLYSVFSLPFFPAHQVLEDGRALPDVPAEEWATLPEIAETPLSTGPYRILEWQQGQRMVFEANPFYYKGEPAIQNLTVVFIPEATLAVSQLLTGEVDVIGNQDLSGGAEVETVLEAAAEGELQAFVVPSPTWEHLDMNLYIR